MRLPSHTIERTCLPAVNLDRVAPLQSGKGEGRVVRVSVALSAKCFRGGEMRCHPINSPRLCYGRVKGPFAMIPCRLMHQRELQCTSGVFRNSGIVSSSGPGRYWNTKPYVLKAQLPYSDWGFI